MQDVGREVYYPQEILNNKILYKDLFNIYGPFAYQFNALLYKFAGANLRTLYLAGSLASLAVISAIYFIARKFFSDFLSFSIGLFVIFTGVCNPSLFNFTFPYSWAMLYGLVSFLYSLLFLIRYNSYKKPYNLIISSVFAGVCACCKYDFILYALLFFIYLIINAKYDYKTSLKAFLGYVFAPVLCFGVLFIQGLRFSDILNTINIFHAMTKSETLKYFYTAQGVYFTPAFFNLFFLSAFHALIALMFMFSGYDLLEKNKIWGAVLLFLSVTILFISVQPSFFVFLPVLLIFLVLLSIKKLDVKDIILAAGALSISLKSVWGLTTLNYGNYFIGILLVCFFMLIMKHLPKDYEKPSAYYIMVIAFFLLIQNFAGIFRFSLIRTPKGNIFTSKEIAQSTSELINYINKNTGSSDKIVIFPEGLIINFLTERQSEGFYNSMLPMYIDIFGEEKLIKHYQTAKPDYIIFSGQNMSDYYYKNICTDYAKGFCDFTARNYDLNYAIKDGFNYLVFKKNNK